MLDKVNFNCSPRQFADKSKKASATKLLSGLLRRRVANARRGAVGSRAPPPLLSPQLYDLGIGSFGDCGELHELVTITRIANL